VWKFVVLSALTVSTLTPPSFAQPLPAAPAHETRLFELRTYYAASGKIDQLDARFRDAMLQLYAKHGMTNIGYFVPVPNPDSKIIFLLAYPNRAAREASWAAFVTDPDWMRVRKQSEVNGQLVDKIEEQLLIPTDYCPVVAPTAGSESRVFELRQFTATGGNLDAINARLRQNITKVFDKHGVQSIGFWTAANPRPGAGATLVYLIGHKSAEAREKAFDAMRSDPAWVAAGKVSGEYADTPLTAKDGKKDGKSVMILRPANYSPMK